MLQPSTEIIEVVQEHQSSLITQLQTIFHQNFLRLDQIELHRGDRIKVFYSPDPLFEKPRIGVAEFIRKVDPKEVSRTSPSRFLNILIENKQIADSYRKNFQLVWKKAKNIVKNENMGS